MTDNQSSCPCASDKCENMENGYYKEFNLNNLIPSSNLLQDCTKHDYQQGNCTSYRIHKITSEPPLEINEDKVI